MTETILEEIYDPAIISVVERTKIKTLRRQTVSLNTIHTPATQRISGFSTVQDQPVPMMT